MCLSMMDKGRWEHFDHAADIGVRGIGPSPALAFAQAGKALFALIACDADTISKTEERRVALEADDLEVLLVDFLSELIYVFDTERLVLGSFDLDLERSTGGRYRLSGSLRGEPFDPQRHEATVEPKGATFTGLCVERRGDDWVAECVVDV